MFTCVAAMTVPISIRPRPCSPVRGAALLLAALATLWAPLLAEADEKRTRRTSSIELGLQDLDGTTISTGVTTAAILVASPSDFTLAECVGENDRHCWRVANVFRLTARISLGDESTSCAKACRLPQGLVYILRDDTYEVAGGLDLACSESAPAQIGTGKIIAGHGRKRRLVPDDLAAVQNTLRACVGGADVRFRSWMKPSRDGTKLKGKTGIRASTRLGPARARFGIKLKHKGALASSGELPIIGRKLQDCPPNFSLRCVLRVGES